MSIINQLIHSPVHLLQLLSSKYSDIREEYESLYLDSLITSKPCHYLSEFKEIAYSSFLQECLKRYYKRNESHSRILYYADYYLNYQCFFCRPVFANYQLTKLMHKRGDTKAELFYRNNYGNPNDNENDSEKHQSKHDSFSSFDNVTNNKTIFDRKTKKRIDDNIATTLGLDNSKGNVSQCIHGSQLYTKRSVNESLRNVVLGMNGIEMIKIDTTTCNANGNNQTNMMYEKRNFRKNKNNDIINQKDNNTKEIPALTLKSSLCSLTKTKGLTNTVNGLGSSDYNKFLLSPKLKPFLATYHSNLIEFQNAKQKQAENRISNINNNQTHKILSPNHNSNQKYSVLVPHLSHKNSLYKARGSNQTYDSKAVIPSSHSPTSSPPISSSSSKLTKPSKPIHSHNNQINNTPYALSSLTQTGSNRNTINYLSNSKCKSQKDSCLINGNATVHNFLHKRDKQSTTSYTNFILNAKYKRMNYITSQRSSSSSMSKNIPSATLNTNHNLTHKHYCLSNSNIHMVEPPHPHSNNNHNHNRGNSFKKPSHSLTNNMQLSTNYNSSSHNNSNFSRNQKTERNVVTIRNQSKQNGNGFINIKGMNNTIDEKHKNNSKNKEKVKEIKCTHSQLKTIIKELANKGDHQTIKFVSKLNELLKESSSGSTLHFVNNNKKMKDKEKEKGRDKEQFYNGGVGGNSKGNNVSLSKNSSNTTNTLTMNSNIKRNQSLDLKFHPTVTATSTTRQSSLKKHKPKPQLMSP